MILKRHRIFVIISFFFLLGAGCESQNLDNRFNTQVTPTTNAQDSVSQSTCNLPPFWGEVSHIFKDCQLKEIEKSQGYLQNFTPEDANGVFEYCNTLVFRHYQTKVGNLYTYEKVRYQHYPNSEAGEYRISKEYYDSITNSRSCVSSGSKILDLSDNDLSAGLFPSRNYALGKDLPGLNILPKEKNNQTVDVLNKEPNFSPNGTYTNTHGNEVPSPYTAPSRPDGASARCADGTYSFSQSRRGTCSHHGGVIEWY